MCNTGGARVAEAILERYRERTAKSRAFNEEAKQRLPGGDTRSITFFQPYPTYMDRGFGCRLTDVDGNEYIDLLNNYTTLIIGHANQKVNEAVRQQLEKGTVLGASAECQFRHAEHLCSRFPGMDMVRYCNSGTEATMFAMRAARAFTGKDAIIKMDGGYHGTHDYAEVNVLKDLPPGSIDSPGVPTAVLQDVYVTPFNDLQAVADTFSRHGERIAAVVVEPMLGAIGLIPPSEGYLEGLRSLADEHDALLVFDEVITFRLSIGGLQRVEGVTPDLTTLGKFIGGGFPVGAFGGKREIMSRYDPGHPNRLSHSGTFNGNNVTMVAGLTAMELYDQQEVDRINRLGARLREGYCQAFKKSGIKGQTTGIGSLVQVHWGEEEIKNARDSRSLSGAARDLPRLLHLELLNQGIFIAPRGLNCISTPMTEKEVDQATSVFTQALEVLKPYVETEAPFLIS
ncbi:MAG TPA: aspartate aminotransferase family protein [Desulfobacterales bacterium]|nr:aspartate aminotransferase family protein [Desulfobacterales bacterium]